MSFIYIYIYIYTYPTFFVKDSNCINHDLKNNNYKRKINHSLTLQKIFNIIIIIIIIIFIIIIL